TEECEYGESLLEDKGRGLAATRRYYEELWRAFPDFSFEVVNRVASEACVVYEMTFRGTQKAPFRGLPSTGRSGEIKGVVVFPMRDGKATGERIYFDGLEYMTQAGFLPRRSSVA